MSRTDAPIRRPLGALLLAALLLLPAPAARAAHAGEDEASLVAARFGAGWGPFEARADAGTLRVQARAPEGAEVRLEFGSALARVVESKWWLPPGNGTAVLLWTGEEILPLRAGSATAQSRGRQLDLLIHREEGEGHLRVEGDARGALAFVPEPEPFRFPDFPSAGGAGPGAAVHAHHHEPPRDAFRFLSHDGAWSPTAAAARGAATVFVTGATLHLRDERAPRVFHLGVERGDKVGPLSLGAGSLLSTRFALLQARDLSTRVTAGDALRVEAFLARPVLDLAGRLDLGPAHGVLHVENATRHVNGTAVSVQGALRVEPRRLVDEPGLLEDARRADPRDDARARLLHPPEGHAAAHELRGAFRAVEVDGVVVAGRPPALDAAPLWLALALLAWQLARAPGAVAAFLVTRFHRVDPLGHPRRRDVLALVEAEPGIHLRAVQRRLGLGWGVVDYHVRVLAAARHVRLRRRRGVLALFPRGRMDDAPPDERAEGTAERILALLQEEGPRTRPHLRDALGLSKQLVHHHVRALERKGLVAALDGPRPRRYAATRPPFPEGARAHAAAPPLGEAAGRGEG